MDKLRSFKNIKIGILIVLCAISLIVIYKFSLSSMKKSNYVAVQNDINDLLVQDNSLIIGRDLISLINDFADSRKEVEIVVITLETVDKGGTKYNWSLKNKDRLSSYDKDIPSNDDSCINELASFLTNVERDGKGKVKKIIFTQK